MFYATSSDQLFVPFSVGLSTEDLQPDFSSACSSASGSVPVVLEANGSAPEDICRMWVKDNDWIEVDLNNIRSLVASLMSPQKLVIAIAHRGQQHSWIWKCANADQLQEVSSAVSSAMRSNDFMMLPMPLSLHFAFAEIKPEWQAESNQQISNVQSMLSLDGEWKWQKTAEVFEDKMTTKDSVEIHYGIQDVDRVTTDRFECYISLLRTITGYDVGFQINAGQLGIASNVHYWHYRMNEEKQARKTLSEISKVSKEFISSYENDKVPFSIIGPKIRSLLRHIDHDHREGTGVFLVQESFGLPVEPDWRETIYGNRYPLPTTGNIADGDFSPKQTFKQEKQKSQQISIDSPHSRSAQYSLKYASSQSDPFSNPVLVKTALYSMVKWIKDTVSIPRVPPSIAAKLLSNLQQEPLEQLLQSPAETLLALLSM